MEASSVCHCLGDRPIVGKNNIQCRRLPFGVFPEGDAGKKHAKRPRVRGTIEDRNLPGRFVSALSARKVDSMNFGRSSSGQRTRVIPAVLLAIAVTVAWLGLSGDSGLAGETKDTQKQKHAQQSAKVSEEQATEIALKRMPGEVTSVVIERKRGRRVYVVEIQTPKGEKDVLVDIQTGEVVGTE